MFDLLVAPDTDEQEHRSQLDFPEDEEEQQVERHEDAHHTSFEQEQQSHILFDTVFLPAADNSQHGEQRIQNDHRQAESVNAETVINFEMHGAGLKVNPGQPCRVRRVDEIAKIKAIRHDTEEYD